MLVNLLMKRACLTIVQTSVEKIRESIPKFYEELYYEIYLNYSGKKDSLNTSAIYSKYSFLANKELAIKLKEEKDKRSRYLSAFIHESYLHSKTSKIKDKVSTLEGNIYIEYEGQKINYRIAPIIITNESNRVKRRELYYKRIKETYKINRYLIKLWNAFLKVSKELGYKNYLEYCEYVNIKNYFKLYEEAKRFLDKTRKLYIDYMSDEFKKLNLDFYESERHDLAYFFRAKEFDQMFPKEKMLEVLEISLNNLGFNFKEYTNIIIDSELREKKTSRAFVSPVKIPEQIYLVLTPKGGQDDYLALFHEAGHAFHFANVERNNEPEFKYLGPASITETFAFLFEYLLLDKNFIRTYFNYNEKYLKFQYIYKLYFLRRYCSKLLYEIELNTRGANNLVSYLYKEIMERNMITKHERALFLIDIDPGMYTAEYLEAWFFETQLRNYLREKFGYEWFKNKGAGEFLKSIWRSGTQYTLEELATKLGFKGISSDYIYEDIVTNLERL